MLYAFSANGTTNCSGTPVTCNPLWTGGGGTYNDNVSPGAPTVSNGVVYYESATNLYAFDADGGTNCSGSPTTCHPLWTAAFCGAFVPSLAVANGILYASSGVQRALVAFDANGVTNCSGTPKVCTSLWTYDVWKSASPPSVANGLVFIGLFNGGPGVQAFDVGGATNCSGTPKVCNPLWTGPTTNPVTGPPAIANGKIYATDNGLIFNPGRRPLRLGPAAADDRRRDRRRAAPSSPAREVLDAGASPGVTQVQYEISGGSFNHSVIATANRTEWRLARRLGHHDRAQRHLYPPVRRVLWR